MFSKTAAAVAAVMTVLSIGCGAQDRQPQSESAALQILREMNRDGRTPSENVAADIARRFGGSRTGALARLVQAKIRFDNKDFSGAAALLDDKQFETKTTVADYALFLRAAALQQAGKFSESVDAYEKLLREYSDSVRRRAARLALADAVQSAGQFAKIPGVLADLADRDDGDALVRLGRSAEAQGRAADAAAFYRRAYFYSGGGDLTKEIEAKLAAAGAPLTPQNVGEATARAERLFATKNYLAAEKAYNDLIAGFPAAATPTVNLRRVTIYSNLRNAAAAQSSFNLIPASANEREEASYQLVLAYARARQWSAARQAAEEMRARFPKGTFLPRAWIETGMIARDARNKGEEQFFLGTAVSAFPNAVEVAGAQFELAWLEHENGNFDKSSQMLTEHLARYADRDTTNRGKAGYWSARDSERAGKIAAACALYEGVLYRYSANWYGYLADQRLAALRGQGKCPAGSAPLSSAPLVYAAVAALRPVSIAPETSTAHDLGHTAKGTELASAGLFDWAIAEMDEAKTGARNSPRVNLALAEVYRYKGDNVGAFLALAKSFPDYSQMFVEEMTRDEWAIFYPLTNWPDIAGWSQRRGLDRYQVAGFIRQESVFNPRARSSANAYGLMQLLLPTARAVARKYGSTAAVNSAEDLYNPQTNIELGTAYIRDQFDKFGRVEYVAVAYNAGPNRVPAWRATLPGEIDEFVEAIPFRETKAYVQGIVRNTAQYRRLYDENGQFRPNVGSRAGSQRGE